MTKQLDLRDAVWLLNLACDTSKSSVNISCPTCGDGRKRKTLNLNFIDNVWHCPVCDIGGGVLDFWAYHRGIEGCNKADTRKKAAVDYRKYEKGINDKEIKFPKKSLPPEQQTEVEAKPIIDRHKVYSSLLEHLSLSEEHYQALLDRGLTKEVILSNQYRSYPLVGHSAIADLLIKEGHILEGIPGFYKKDDKWRLVPQSSSILIPTRTGRGEIQAFQVRVDEPLESGKYKTLSSRFYPFGAGANASIHLRIGNRGFTNIILTEGPLKADIISHFSGYTVLAMPGVNAKAQLPSWIYQLKSKGLQKIYIAFDMDLHDNIHVQKALEKVKSIIEEQHVSYGCLEWNNDYKGLDDYLYFKSK